MMQTGEGGRGAEAGHGQVRGLAPLMSSPALQESWRHPPPPRLGGIPTNGGPMGPIPSRAGAEEDPGWTRCRALEAAVG